jgi:hypothetical protein
MQCLREGSGARSPTPAGHWGRLVGSLGGGPFISCIPKIRDGSLFRENSAGKLVLCADGEVSLESLCPRSLCSEFCSKCSEAPEFRANLGTQKWPFVREKRFFPEPAWLEN